jgi:hypothetical protein
MKKIIFLIFFAALILPRSSFAQTVAIPMPSISVTPSVAPSPINYELPYPGILPGSPLYSFKLLRDRITDIFTSNPLKKSNFYLLQADKRLAASLLLYKEGNTKLAGETLTRGVNYLEKSYDKMLEVKKINEDVSDIHLKLQNSSEKQLQEIEKLMETVKGEEAEKLKENYQRVQEVKNKVN